jgi:hypothetical protein
MLTNETMEDWKSDCISHHVPGHCILHTLGSRVKRCSVLVELLQLLEGAPSFYHVPLSPSVGRESATYRPIVAAVGAPFLLSWSIIDRVHMQLGRCAVVLRKQT